MGSNQDFNSELSSAIVRFRRVDVDKLRHHVQTGNRYAINQMRSNAELLLILAYRYDVKSAPKDQRKQTEDRIARIKQAAFAFQGSLAAAEAGRFRGELLTALHNSHEAVLLAGRGLIENAAAHLLEDYDDKLGLCIG